MQGADFDKLATSSITSQPNSLRCNGRNGCDKDL